jgi:hypothetical protein
MEAETERYLMDELEAGEAAVELDDKEPQEVLAWAIEKFGRRLGVIRKGSTWCPSCQWRR